MYLPPAGHTSQNDLFVLANGEQGLVTIMVEGKVAEPFGETLESWLNSPTPGKLKRLAFILDLTPLVKRENVNPSGIALQPGKQASIIEHLTL